MHLFADSCQSGQVYDMYQWNAVDVLINGSLQHGIVKEISAASADGQKHGLRIDFCCPQRRYEFVEYGNIFRSPDVVEYSWERWKQVTAWAETRTALQALLRVGRDRAWTWWPVQLAVPKDDNVRRAYCNDIECGLVEVQWGAAQTKELIPLAQIRCVPSSEDLQVRRVGADYFVVRACRLPKGYWVDPPLAARLLWQKINREFSACCVVVRKASFTYLQRSDADPILLDKLEETFDFAKSHQSVQYTAHSDSGKLSEENGMGIASWSSFPL
ncbi:uncharacterized protein LOC129590992 isoform X1 [Paramacrobiotus metropolitanus]|uniref:uncharacterized protein LOC129590992 isoform X1 n=1 Tax=Paramacrobiotus metropolitanus TaxID=2943436 RepID=UPI00244565C6|nr:uncharacterized protein LOC129590992 isoform X1 [Paramacrobiotus metropolitanus]